MFPGNATDCPKVIIQIVTTTVILAAVPCDKDSGVVTRYTS